MPQMLWVWLGSSLSWNLLIKGFAIVCLLGGFLPGKAVNENSVYFSGVQPACDTLSNLLCMYYWRAGASQPSRTTGAIFLYIYIYISIRRGEATYRIFLNVSTRFFFTVTSRHFTGHTYTLDSHGKVQSSSSWSCSLTSLLETDRDTEVSHHSLPLLLLCSVE